MAETRLKIDAEAEVSTTELAAILGVTARRVQQMAQDGTIIPVRRGYFQLGDAVQRYINFLSKPQISEAEQKLETAKRQSEAQLKLSKAQLAKMEVEELKGKLHRSEDVEGFTEDRSTPSAARCCRFRDGCPLTSPPRKAPPKLLKSSARKSIRSCGSWQRITTTLKNMRKR